MEKEIVFFSDNQLPEGNPNATRIVSLAKGFQAIGYRVVMVGLNKKFLQDNRGIYSGVAYELLTFPELKMLGGMNRIRRAKATFDFFYSWLKERQKMYKTKAIVYSGGSNGLTGKFLSLSRRMNVPIIYNWVEWFQKPMFPGTFGWIRYMAYLYEFHFMFPRFKNVIAISSLLDEYARKHGCNSVRIPTIVDTEEYKIDKKIPLNDKLILSYAGKIAKKDLMVNVLKSFELLNLNYHQMIELHIYGITEKELLLYANGKDSWPEYIGKSIFCEGFIPYSEVRTNIQLSDFTVLLRKQWKNANAGFPTKIGESMAAGVPVIANITSDIGMYLHDEIEGIVCKDNSPESFKKALERVLRLDPSQKEKMRINARKQAEISFDYRQYKGQLKELINNIK